MRLTRFLTDLVMAEVIDVRPDRFLRELRDGKNITEATEAAGMTTVELNDLITVNPPFALAARECIAEHAEENMQIMANSAVKQIRDLCQNVINKLEAILAESIKEVRGG